MKKAVHYLLAGTDFLWRNLLLAAALLILCLAVYSETETARQIHNASGARFQTYKPSAEDDLSFQDLTAQNPDVIGWIMIPDTQIDYPLVQGKNNEESGFSTPFCHHSGISEFFRVPNTFDG